METMALANMLCGEPLTGSMGCGNCPRSMGSVSGEIDPLVPLITTGESVAGLPPGTTASAATLVDLGGGLFKSKKCGKCRYKARNGKCGRIHTPKCDAFWSKSKAGPSGKTPAGYPWPQHAALYPVGHANNPAPGYGNESPFDPPVVSQPVPAPTKPPVYQTPGVPVKQAGVGGLGWAIAAAAALGLAMMMKK